MTKEIDFKSQQQNFKRIEFLDFTRGFAILLMFIFHLAFGLSQIKLIEIDMAHSNYWIAFRLVIVFLFLTLVGIGIILAKRKSNFLIPYLKRLFLLGLYAGLISWFSYSVRPFSYVFFGILHLIFIASIICLFFTRFYWLNLLLAVASFVSLAFRTSWFDDKPLLWWLGLAQQSPITDDFAPIFPWIGFVFLGLFVGIYLFEKNQNKAIEEWKASGLMAKLLTWAGRYSIHLYFFHFQFFYLLVWLFR